MTEITDLDPVDSGNTAISGESLDGAIANMGRMDNTLQAFAGMLGRSIRTAFMRIIDSTDSTKRIAFDLSGLPTATTRTLGAPYYSGTLGLVSDIRGQIYGLTLSNNVTDPTNDIDIAAGSAVDSTGTVSMLLASAFTKRLDAAWAVGSGNGGRMSAAAIADETYHVFLIRRPDTGVVDVGFDVSDVAPTLPANYTQFRRIGSIVRLAASIKAFVQYGDLFSYRIFETTIVTSNPGVAAVTAAVAVPTSIKPIAILQSAISNAGAGGIAYGILTNLDVTDQAPNLNYSDVPAVISASGGVVAAGFAKQVVANASGQIRYRLAFSSADVQIVISTIGWIDTRGRS